MRERGREATGGETLSGLLMTLLSAGGEPAAAADVAACVAAGRVFIDGRRLRSGDLRLAQDEVLQAGQRVELSARAHNTSEAPRVLEARWGLLAVLKPSGLASEPDRRGTDSLVSRIAQQLGQDVHAVSRLDAQVSGLMLVATDEAARKLAAGFNAATFERYYTGLVADSAAGPCIEPGHSGQGPGVGVGVGPALSGTWRGSIGDAERGRRKVGGRGAKPAVTQYRELPPGEASSQASLERSAELNAQLSASSAPGGLRLPTWRQGRERRELRCRRLGFQIETGRTHQIRAHTAHAGLPLLGDPLYGGPGAAVLPNGNVLEFTRIALHASELIVRHAGDTWRVSTPMPEILEAWSARLLGQIE